MVSIQRMAHKGFPLVALAQQGAEVVDLVIAERSTGNPWREPSVDNDQVRRARSDASSSASGNHCLADNDARRWITQSCHLRETSCECDDLRNVIEDRKCLKARTLSAPH
jgi:hypothetical protein